jgi:microcystin-dependent protein
MIRKMLLASLFALALSSLPAYAGANPFLGEVEIFGFNFCPVGWSTMQGQLLSISQNTALFSLLGTTYGGNGTTTFALPTAKPILTFTPGAEFTQCIALQGIFPSRN